MEDDRYTYDDADTEPDDTPNPGPQYHVDTFEGGDVFVEEKPWALLVAGLAVLGAIYEPSIAHSLTILAGMVTLMHYLKR